MLRGGSDGFCSNKVNNQKYKWQGLKLHPRLIKPWGSAQRVPVPFPPRGAAAGQPRAGRCSYPERAGSSSKPAGTSAIRQLFTRTNPLNKLYLYFIFFPKVLASCVVSTLNVSPSDKACLYIYGVLYLLKEVETCTFQHAVLVMKFLALRNLVGSKVYSLL